MDFKDFLWHIGTHIHVIGMNLNATAHCTSLPLDIPSFPQASVGPAGSNTLLQLCDRTWHIKVPVFLEIGFQRMVFLQDFHLDICS